MMRIGHHMICILRCICLFHCDFTNDQCVPLFKCIFLRQDAASPPGNVNAADLHVEMMHLFDFSPLCLLKK